MNTKLAGRLVLMLALAAGTFAAMIALMQSRIGHPVTPAASDLVGANSRPLDAVTQGVRQSLAAAQSGLQNHQRTDGVRALDAAMRAAGVAKEAAAATGSAAALGRAYQTIVRARLAIQNDRESDALQLIASAASLLPDQVSPGDVPTPPHDPASYAGAAVINAEGVRIGEVKRVESDGVILSLGGYRDVLGFLDIGGQQLRVDTRDLLFGKKKTLGNTFVSLPTAATSPNAVAARFRSVQQ